MDLEPGLTEAKRRLSRAGMHDGKCREPDEPCTCGIDDAIDNPVARAWNESPDDDEREDRP